MGGVLKMMKLLLILLQSYIKTTQKPVYSLHKQPERMMVNEEMKFLIVAVIILSILFILIFMFSIGTESGVWYNNPHY